MPLDVLLKREFEMAYYGQGGFPISEQRKLNSRLLDWHYRRLIQQKQDEEEEFRKIRESRIN